jgi:hypothetical protein
VRGSIKASVFEYGMVQAVGGILLVRPSTNVKSVIINADKTIKAKVEDITGFKVNDYCLFGTSEASDKIYYKVAKILEDKVLILEPALGEISENYAGPIIDMG